MPRFFTGDELGSVKSVRYLQDSVEKQWKPEVHIISSTPAEARPVPVQKLAFSVVGTDKVLAAARGDGSASIYRIQEDESVSSVAEWKEARLKPGQRYVGLSVSEKRVFSCTSNGALRATTLGEGDSAPSAQTSVLPMRLCEWRLSHDAQTFAYGGDEVELSVWDTERAFAPRDNIPADAESKKRKRGGELLPGEVWRAKNVCVARYPCIEASSDYFVSSEVFVSDNGSNLFALDLRNGRVIYGYKSTVLLTTHPPQSTYTLLSTGIAGAVSSVAHSPSVLASVAQDRFLRLHSTFPPPKEPGQQQEHKGEVLDKLYMKAVPTVVVWDQSADASQAVQGAEEAGEEADDDDDVWDAMEDVEDEETGGRWSGKKKSRTAE
ncbi:hypothetical protein EVJ58_g2931 [Rhodofomes roseus]|uniref:Ribosome biogenesis protein NSA1 n=1 Tax=Rhodofomes roseus TaxID=34475 RepID=A0A4Y9YR16_9APHY|nr:hypothetical protein EVJ58_g2931 [Rhodofomes roseus]